MLGFVRRSIAVKIALTVGLSCLIVTLLGLTWMMRLYQADIREHTNSTLASVSRTLTGGFHAHDSRSGTHPMPEMMSHIGAGDEILQVRVFDPRGVVKWSLDVDEPGKKIPGPVLERFRHGRVTTVSDPDKPLVEIIRQVRARRSCLSCHGKSREISTGDILGGIHLQASYAKLNEKLTGYGRLQVVTALLLVGFVGVMTVLMVRMFLGHPLRNLHRAIEEADRGNYLSRVEAGGQDEIGRVADDFNQLLAKLTDVQASKIDTDVELGLAQRELKLKEELEDKNRIIEETNRKLSRRLRELALLYDFNRALNASLEIDQVLRVIEEKIGHALGFSELLVLLMDENNQNLQIRATMGQRIPDDQIGRILEITEGPHAQAVQRRQPVLTRHVEELDPLLRSHDSSGPLPETGSVLSVPMRSRERSLGLLVFERTERDAFADDEVQLLTSVTGAAAMAIVNALLYQEKAEMSITDELTQLANRRQMHTRLEREWKRAQRFDNPLSLLMIDIDKFKRYNDINGHLLGDEVLKGVSGILQGNTRTVDTVARFGGEEFVVILPEQDKESAAGVADKLRRTVYQTDFPRSHRQPGGHLAISVGVASYPEDADDPHTLLDRSDMALYVAKRTGRNRVVTYEQGMQEHEEERRRARQEKEERKNRKRRRRRKPKQPKLDFLEPT